MIDSIVAIGDAGDMACWSGLPYHCLQAAGRLGWATRPWRLHLSDFVWPRRFWHFRQMLRLRGIGGYQYSAAFLQRAEDSFLQNVRGQWVLSFHHHFPRARRVQAAGGRIVYFLDATLAAELDGHAIRVRLPSNAVRSALAIERENLSSADHVVTMSRWLRDYLVAQGHVPSNRLSVVMPGANLDLPATWRPAAEKSRAGGPFILGLVGNDWERKGLPFLIEVVRELRRRRLEARVRVVGRCPKDIDPETTDVLGPIDKRSDLPAFVAAIAGCDLGCLFSDQEAFGVSLLEFLRVGRPVAGFDREGPSDSIPPDAGFRFPPGTSARAVADTLADYIGRETRQREFRQAAAAWSPLVTWERCLGEMAEVLKTGQCASPVRPWRGPAMVNFQSHS